MDSLYNPGALYSLPNRLPSSRVHHAMAIGPLDTEEFVIVHGNAFNSERFLVYIFSFTKCVNFTGGYASDGTYLDDLHIFDTRSQRWSGVVLRMHGYDDHGR